MEEKWEEGQTFDPSPAIGMTLDEAEKFFNGYGYTVRPTRIGGSSRSDGWRKSPTGIRCPLAMKCGAWDLR